MPKGIRRAAAGLLTALALAVATLPTPALADEYESDRAGHPVRIIAYLLHPVGVTLEYLLFRPAHWLVHHEPLKTLFGHEDRG